MQKKATTNDSKINYSDAYQNHANSQKKYDEKKTHNAQNTKCEPNENEINKICVKWNVMWTQGKEEERKRYELDEPAKKKHREAKNVKKDVQCIM